MAFPFMSHGTCGFRFSRPGYPGSVVLGGPYSPEHTCPERTVESTQVVLIGLETAAEHP